MRVPGRRGCFHTWVASLAPCSRVWPRPLPTHRITALCSGLVGTAQPRQGRGWLNRPAVRSHAATVSVRAENWPSRSGGMTIPADAGTGRPALGDCRLCIHLYSEEQRQGTGWRVNGDPAHSCPAAPAWPGSPRAGRQARPVDHEAAHGPAAGPTLCCHAVLP